MRNKLAIVGIFYDGYYDMWEDFLELFETNWPECPYPLYIVNNEKELSFNKQYNVNVLHAGKDAEYSRKVQKAISEIDADYFLILLEDFFVEKRLMADALEQIMDNIVNEKYLYYRMPLPEFGGNNKKNKDKKYPFLNRISTTDEYTLTCQPSIWEKNFLKKCIGDDNYNAWIFEGIYCYSETAHTEEFLDKCRVDYRNVITLRHGAVQGKLLPNVYNDFRNAGYTFKTNREVLGEKAYKKHIGKQKIKNLMPVSVQKAIKKILKTDSVIERYKNEIESVMEKMGLE